MTYPLVHLRRLASLAYGDSLPVESRRLGDVPVFGSGGLVGTHDVANTLGPSIVVGRKGSHGAVHWSPVRAFAIDTTYFIDARHVRCDLRYLYYVLLDADLSKLETDVGVPGLSRTLAYDTLVPLPPHPEQQRIARYLDEQIAEMAAVEAVLTRTRALLDERSAASSRSALLGTHEHGSRRVIDLGWVAGEIPTDWPVAPVGARFEVQLGRMLNQERASGPDMRPYIRNVNVRWDRVDVADLAEMDFPAEDRPRYRLRPGDLLVNEGGAGVGRAAVWDGSVEEIYIQKSVHRVRPRRGDDVRWLAECLRVAVASDIFKASGNAAIPHFPADQFRAWRIPLPPPEAQTRLLAELAQTRAQLTAAAAAVEAQQTLLAERRRVLISEAVAGKLDVGAAA